MKKTVFLMVLTLMFFANAKAQEEVMEVTAGDAETISEQLEKEANVQEDKQSREFLKKIASAFRNTKKSIELDVKKATDDCVDCSRGQKRKNIFSMIGRKLGKGAAWVSTTTTKPFVTATGFVKGLTEKGSKNQELVALYQFFLNHREEFDKLYLEAGTPEEMVELMLAKMEEIMDKKTNLIIKDFLIYVGVPKEVPDDLSTFELTDDEIAQIDMSKVDVEFINRHPEFQEVKPLIGEMTKEELMDMVTNGYFNKAISFENYKDALPSPFELAAGVVGQIFVPKIALGVVSSTLAGLYATPVIAADIGTGISTAVCLQKSNQRKFKDDEDFKMFCSYVTNRSAYELMKSRARGYIAGKKTNQKISKRLAEFREKRAEKKRQKELAKRRKELAQLN